MSLLMEALKKAEQAKQGAQDAPATGIELQLEPIDSGGTAGETTESADAAAAAESAGEAKPAEGKTLPQLPAQLEVLDPQFIAHAEAGKRAATQEKPQPQPQQPPPAAARPASPPPFAQPTRPGREPATGPVPARPPRPATASGPPPDADRAAAQQVFSAKQPERSRKGFAIAVGVMIVLGLGGIGGYFWWQLQPKSGLIATRPAATAPLAKPLAAPPVAAAPAPPAATGPAPAAQRQAPPVDDEDEDAGDAPPSKAAAVARPAARSAAQAAAVPADAQSPIRISKSRLQANPAIERAFEAMNAGDLAAAQGEYDRVLRDEPKNAEALLGMAAIAVRRGDAAGADEWYLKALEADPKDATAQAGLIGLRGQGDPQAQESRLKSLIAAQPDVATLHFALGNVYARQARWNEAQQAYFKAFSASPDNPDYLFNLAVSLDHLRQGRLAAQYYDQALAAAAQRPAGFDKAQAAARLRELRP